MLISHCLTTLITQSPKLLGYKPASVCVRRLIALKIRLIHDTLHLTAVSSTEIYCGGPAASFPRLTGPGMARACNSQNHI